MRKNISSFICLSFLISNQMCFGVELFHDYLAEKLNKNLKVESYTPNVIVDDFANKTLDKNLKIQKQEYFYDDEFAKRTLNQNLKINSNKYLIEDELINKIDRKIIAQKENKKVAQIVSLNDKIKISPLKYYTTRKSELNDKIEFVLLEDIKINNVLYKKNQIVTAKVENISQNGAYGVPADLVVGSFKIGEQNLEGTIVKQGANRAIWVYPTAYILSPFFGLGLFVLPIRGGHAKLKPNKIYEVDI